MRERFTSVTDLVVGQRLGDFVVEEQIGSGGMGLVYRAVQPVIGRKVAVKVMRHDMAADSAQAERFLGEARAISKIRHRGIVSVFSFGTLKDGRHYMVMEFLEGESLDAMMAREGQLPLRTVLPMLDEILDALGAVHSAGVVHRDLKPSNVFIARETNGSLAVKVLDFGLAKQAPLGDLNARPGARASLIGGTPEYISPEQIRGETAVEQSDLYSLGVLTFEALTRRLPFVADGVEQLLDKHLNEPAPRAKVFRGDMPPMLDELIHRMMAKAISDRPGSAKEVRRIVGRLMQELKVQGDALRRPTWDTMTALVSTFPKSAGRRRKVLGAGASLAAATLAFNVAYFAPGPRASAEERPRPPVMAAVRAPAPVPPPEVPVASEEPAPEVAAPPEAAPSETATAPPVVIPEEFAIPLDEPEVARPHKHKASNAAPKAKAAPAVAANRPSSPPPPPVVEQEESPREWMAKLEHQLIRAEERLIKSTPPGEDPSRNALNLLRVLRQKATVAAQGTPREREALAQSVVAWERQFLK